MYRATTPTHTFELPFDCEQFVSKILITYKQGSNIILEKTESDVSISGKNVQFQFTQEETNLFKPNIICDIQIRVLTKGGQSLTSQEWHKTVEDVLNDKVL